MTKLVCIHGHFYQPPRENPWLEEVELQDSAYPYHDWNSRVTAECYGPNTASRIMTDGMSIIDIVNNYSRISFNFGPTLLAWLQRHELHVYEAILDADKLSRERFSGHGSALAQVYNHLIMPLANSRDKRTQVAWGIEDFRSRFKREPEGMWLAETAVDIETLELLSEYNIKFTILAPHQAKRIRKTGGEDWLDVSPAKINSRLAYLCRLPSGRSINLFFYDGPISQEVAFSKLLNQGENFAHRLFSSIPSDKAEGELAHIATDGETYGHHHRFGDMALSYCLYYLEANKLAKVTVYGEYLEQYPVVWEVEIHENSSWSCSHGVERWRKDCGCNSGTHGGWNQLWRAPLRGAMDWLRDNLVHIFEEHSHGLLKDPWAARDTYIKVIFDRSKENVDGFMQAHSSKELSPDEKIKVLKLLEMQRYSLLMYTSCGWFFDEISGLETVQVMAYAARAMQLAKEISSVSLEDAYKGLLERAPSNIPEFKNGSFSYERFIQPQVLGLLRVGVHYAVSSLFSEQPQLTKLYVYKVTPLAYALSESGKQRMAVGRVRLCSEITWEEDEVSFAVLHLGDHNVVGGARSFRGDDAFEQLRQGLNEAFSKGETPEVLRLIDSNFSSHSYSLWHLFKDEQRRVLSQILESNRKEAENSFRQIYAHQYPFLQAFENMGIPLPEHLRAVLTFILNSDLRAIMEKSDFDAVRLEKLSLDAKKFSLKIEKEEIEFLASLKINRAVEELFRSEARDFVLLESIISFIKALEVFSLDLNLWGAQNIYFSFMKKYLAEADKKNLSDQDPEGKWHDNFVQLGDCLKTRVN
ncbi:MAG: DUF3536 domain-containing protein [Candidatus Omnitrophota bacterium]|nr:DUF3536 domain-containing protein [Candidatus Omnitrophota bacterium]